MRLLSIGGSLLTAALAVMTTGGCANRMHDENLAMHQQNREQQAVIDRQRAELEAVRGREQTAEMTPVAPPATQASQAQTPAPPPPVQTQAQTQTPPPINIEGTETTQDPVAGTMTVRVPGDVLFDPGQATVRAAARATLDKVAAALKKDYAGKQIRVEGHTDADPIRVSKWKDNQHLSEARAQAVREYLVQKGLEANSVTTTGFGATKPKGNDKAQNRRVEIVVVTR